MTAGDLTMQDCGGHRPPLQSSRNIHWRLSVSRSGRLPILQVDLTQTLRTPHHGQRIRLHQSGRGVWAAAGSSGCSVRYTQSRKQDLLQDSHLSRRIAGHFQNPISAKSWDQPTDNVLSTVSGRFRANSIPFLARDEERLSRSRSGALFQKDGMRETAKNSRDQKRGNAENLVVHSPVLPRSSTGRRNNVVIGAHYDFVRWWLRCGRRNWSGIYSVVRDIGSSLPDDRVISLHERIFCLWRSIVKKDGLVRRVVRVGAWGWVGSANIARAIKRRVHGIDPHYCAMINNRGSETLRYPTVGHRACLARVRASFGLAGP